MSRTTLNYRDPSIKPTHAFTLAHSARCKLHMSAKDPDRNLRFMLGHSFMLDKALYRVAQIEEDDDDDAVNEPAPVGGQGHSGSHVAEALREEDGPKAIDGDGGAEGQTGSLAGGTVNFKAERDAKKQDPPSPDGDRTPPDEEYDDYDLDDDDANNMGLTRFTSASQRPPRMIPDEGDEDEEDLDEAISPPALPADFDVSTVIAGPESGDVGDLYERVRGCPCHGLGEKAEKGRKFWEVSSGKSGDGGVGKPGKRMAIMQVEV